MKFVWSASVPLYKSIWLTVFSMYFEMRQMNAVAASYPHMTLTQYSCHSLFSMMACDLCAAEAGLQRTAQLGEVTGQQRHWSSLGCPEHSCELCLLPETRPAWRAVAPIASTLGVAHWMNIFIPCHNFFCSQLERGLTVPAQFWQSCICLSCWSWATMPCTASLAEQCWAGGLCPAHKGSWGQLQLCRADCCMWAHTLGAWMEAQRIHICLQLTMETSHCLRMLGQKGQVGNSWIWNIKERLRLALFGRKRVCSPDSKTITKRTLVSQGPNHRITE